jgi:predicted AAA+ superfamily ATPase
MVENFVIQQLKIVFDKLFYWQSEGKAEIDLIIDDGSHVIPIEIKAGESSKSKSLHVYDKKFNPKHAVQCNLKNFSKSGRFCNYPLYAASLIGKQFSHR